MAGWITRPQDAVIQYFREENRVLKQQLGRRRLRLTDEWIGISIAATEPSAKEHVRPAAIGSSLHAHPVPGQAPRAIRAPFPDAVRRAETPPKHHRG